MSPKGSKELNKKNGFLGQFQKIKKQISKMEVMILEQEPELKNTGNQIKEIMNEINLRKNEFNQRKIEMESLNKKIKIISQEINDKNRKLAHKNLVLSDVVGETNPCISKISNLKKKSAFEISVCAAKKRKLNPTNRKLPIRSKTIRRKQTMDSSMAIHGGQYLIKHLLSREF